MHVLFNQHISKHNIKIWGRSFGGLCFFVSVYLFTEGVGTKENANQTSPCGALLRAQTQLIKHDEIMS